MDKTRRASLKAAYRMTSFGAIILVFLLIYLAALLGLLTWAVVTSFEPYGPEAGFFSNVWDSFSHFTIRVQGRKDAISFAEMLRNSLLYSLGCAFSATLVSCFTAYAVSRYHYWFSRVVYAIVIITMIIPSVGSLPAEVSLAIRFGLYDHIWGQWVMKANFLSLYFLIFYDFFAHLPQTYFEAAEMDGAGDGCKMFRIALPLAKTLIGTVFLLNFVMFWNDYAGPTIYLKSKPTLAVGLYSTFNYGITYYKLNGAPAIVPIAFTIASPVIAIYAIFHRQLTRNLNIGGIKE